MTDTAKPHSVAKVIAMACSLASLPGLLRDAGLPDDLRVGQDTHCPYHDDEIPSASLLALSQDHPSYGLYCHACKKYWSLIDIYKERVSGNLLSIHTDLNWQGKLSHHNQLRVIWTGRACEDAGTLRYVEVGLPLLPPWTPDYVKPVWDAFLRTRRLRRMYGDNKPFPFSIDYIMDFLGGEEAVNRYDVIKGKAWLIRNGFMHQEGKELDEYSQEKPCGAYLWSIGNKHLRKYCADPDVKVPPSDGKNIDAVKEVEANLPPEPVPGQGSVCPDATVLDTHCGYCPTCGSELDTDGFVYFCASCEAERASPVCT